MPRPASSVGLLAAASIDDVAGRPKTRSSLVFEVIQSRHCFTARRGATLTKVVTS